MITAYREFETSLKGSQPPSSWPIVLKALWHDARGDWDTAHHLVDQSVDPMAKWVHAYLHRKEGDDWNARYWYRQAGKPFCKLSLKEELINLVTEFIH